ncbi:MAG: hypothetical protein ACRDCE_22600 [Cetobacterium sp.]|uniref:hypothetical protein n=1 Tax=Cetobacterium sp. TaxID=2071632 RepID=UPI003EE59FF9
MPTTVSSNKSHNEKVMIVHELVEMIVKPYADFLFKQISELCIKNGTPYGFFHGKLKFMLGENVSNNFGLQCKPELLEEAQILFSLKEDYAYKRNLLNTAISSLVARATCWEHILQVMPDYLAGVIESKFAIIRVKEVTPLDFNFTPQVDETIRFFFGSRLLIQ